MVLKVGSIDEFIESVSGKTVVCYGAGYWLSALSKEFNSNIEKTYSYIVDRNSSFWGSTKDVNGVVLKIFSPQKLYDEVDEQTIVLITIAGWEEIFELLDDLPQFKDVICYAAPLIYAGELDRMARLVPSAPINWRMNSDPQIPKIIHYIWFGKEKIPQKYKDYIGGWKAFCPDYEFVEWNMDNYDLTIHPFLIEAKEHKQWAAASDYARLDIVYQYGGIYFDVDVELIRNIDELLYNTAFFGFQDLRYVGTGLGFGARKNYEVVRLLRDDYDDISFLSAGGVFETIPCPDIQTKTLERLGLKRNGEFQIVCGVTIYPVEYFSPLNFRTGYIACTPNTYSIHHYEGLWEGSIAKAIWTKRRRIIGDSNGYGLNQNRVWG